MTLARPRGRSNPEIVANACCVATLSTAMARSNCNSVSQLASGLTGMWKVPISRQGDIGAKITPTPCLIAVPPENRWRPRLGTPMKADGTGDSLAIVDVDLESPHGGAVELSFAGDDDEEGVDFGVLDHVAGDVRQHFGVEEVAGCASVHGHVEANRLGVRVGREKREAHVGWRDGKGCRGTRRMLSSRVVCGTMVIEDGAGIIWPK